MIITSHSLLAPSGAVSPSDFSGLIFWIKSDTGITESGGDISQWNDLSTSANHMVQATGSAKPSLVSSVINSLPAVYFDDAGPEYMDASVHAYSTNIDLFIVAKLDASLSGNKGLCVQRDTFYIRAQEGTDGPIAWYTYADVNGRGLGGGDLSDAFHLVHFQYASGTGQAYIYVDGTSVASDTGQTGTLDTSTYTWSIGKDLFDFYKGYIAEIAVYDAGLTGGEISQLKSYFGDRYGLTIA